MLRYLSVFSLFVENAVPRCHGNPPVNYIRKLGGAFNLLTGMPFPQDGTVVGWVYYLGTGKYYRFFKEWESVRCLFDQSRRYIIDRCASQQGPLLYHDVIILIHKRFGLYNELALSALNINT